MDPKEDFDVVVLDLKMHSINGIATLKEIKKLDLFTQTLILTGHGAVDTAMEAVKFGVYDYLTKPCTIEELTEKIEEARTKKGEEERKDLTDGYLMLNILGDGVINGKKRYINRQVR